MNAKPLTEQDFRGLGAHRVASMLLVEANGVARTAEAKAWEFVAKYPPKSEGFEFWLAVTSILVDGTEHPAVERRPYLPTQPTYSPPEFFEAVYGDDNGDV